VRIIGGQWRGRVLQFAGSDELRPTGDRMRETLFNWLQFELHGKRCLDLFAGSGALGFEAASRGAAELVLVEPQTQAVASLRENVALLGSEGVSVSATNAANYLRAADRPFDVVFLDPPFARELLAEAVDLLDSRALLSPSAWIYIEQPRDRLLPALPDSWLLHREKAQGQVVGRLYRHEKCCTAT
jgi:16S rRNA (guanine966-N2)-methyltransferase